MPVDACGCLWVPTVTMGDYGWLYVAVGVFLGAVDARECLWLPVGAFVCLRRPVLCGWLRDPVVVWLCIYVRVGGCRPLWNFLWSMERYTSMSELLVGCG